MDSPQKKTKKSVRIAEEARADKGYDFYVLGKFVGNFQTLDEGRQGVIDKYNLKDGNECIAWCRDVTYIKA